MNANIPYYTQEFIQRMKELERIIREVAEMRGLGETVESTRLCMFGSAGKNAEKALQAVQTAAAGMFTQAKRMLNAKSFEEAEASAIAAMDADIAALTQTNRGAR